MKKAFCCLLIGLMSITLIANKSVASYEADLGRIVVTATRIAQHDYKITGNVTVIDKEQIEASNAQNVPDVIKEALGVNVYDNCTAKSSVIDIRGFGETAGRNVLVLVNDRKINSADMSGADLVQVPIDAVEKIEIIRGAGSVLYGDNAVGGVVNIITKQGKGDLSGKVGFTYGSYGTKSNDVELSGELKNVSYFVNSKYLDQKGYRMNSDMLAKDFNSRLGYKFSDKISMDLNFGWHEDDQELPGGLYGSEVESLGRRATQYEKDTFYTKDRFVNLGLDLNPWPDDWDFGKLVVDFYYRNRDGYEEFNRWGSSHTKRSTNTKGIVTKYIFDRTIFGKEVNFVTGIDYYDNASDIYGSGSNPDDLTISKEELGIYGFLQYELLNNLFVNGGTRYHQAEFAFSQRNVMVDEKQRPEVWASMGGMKYEYAEGSNVHFNVQQTFRFLATDEWYTSDHYPAWGITAGLDTTIDQQTGIQYEMGVKHNFDNKVEVNVTPYWMDLKNEIYFEPVAFANQNYDKTRRRGVEIGGRVNLLKFMKIDFFDKFEFFSNYTFQDAKFNGGANDGNYLTMVPQHQASSGVSMSFLDNYNFSFMGKYIGSRFAINDTGNTTQRIKPHYVVDAKIAYKNRNLEIFAALNNVFNEKYSSYVAKSTSSNLKMYYPAPERNFNLGINLKF